MEEFGGCKLVEFCENGVKVVVEEVIKCIVIVEFFVWYLVVELFVKFEYWLF